MLCKHFTSDLLKYSFGEVRAMNTSVLLIVFLLLTKLLLDLSSLTKFCEFYHYGSSLLLIFDSHASSTRLHRLFSMEKTLNKSINQSLNK